MAEQILPKAAPYVAQDHNKHTAIVVSIGSKLTHYVEMDARQLSLREAYHAVFAETFKPITYDTAKACEKFLAHRAGLTNEARAALNGAMTTITKEAANA